MGTETSRRLVIIGGGNMGSAIAKGVLAANIVDSSDLFIIEPVQELVKSLKTELKCTVLSDLSAFKVIESDALLFAVKPQDLEKVTQGLISHLALKPLIISILAGASVARLSKACAGTTRIIRVMPNLGAQVGKAVSVVFASNAVNEDDLFFANKLFSACGLTIQVKTEDLVDAGTAISGSGPAYVCQFIEDFQDCAMALGFSAENAERMVEETILGTLSVIKSKKISASELRKAVTSPKGTTEAALSELQKGPFKEAIMQAVKRAFERAKELSA